MRGFLVDEMPRESRGLPALGASLRHHWGTIAVAVCLAVGAAAFYVFTMPLTYTSAAVALLSPAPGNPLTPESASGSAVQLTVAMETEAELVRTAAVREAVAEELGRLVPAEDETLRVTVPSNTQMLEVSVTSSSPLAAQEGAQSLAVGYLEYRAERARAVQEARVETLRRQSAETDENLRRAIADAASDGVSSYASQEVQLFADRLAQLNNALSAAEAVSTEPGLVINPAEVPMEDNELPAWVFLAAAALLGFVGGGGLAILREWRRDLVRVSRSDELGIPVFSTIRLPTEDRRVSSADGEIHEAYRRLRAAVVANGPRPHVLAVAAVDENPSSAVATSLATVLAEAGFNVLLIATDTRSGVPEHMLGVGRQRGLAEVVQEDASARELLIESHGVRVLTRGVDLAGARDLTARPAFRELVDDLRSEFDYVVLDAATAGSADGDAALLAADSVLLVLTPDRTTRARLSAALERFERLGIATLGAVKVGRKRTRRPNSKDREASVTPPAMEVAEDIRIDRVQVRAHA